MVIDCTEIYCQGSKNFKKQGNSYSSYKGRTTAKVLIGCDPSGNAVFISDAFEGSVSDKDICQQSGFYDWIQKGDQVLADRGFLIEEELRAKGAFLNIPPFLRGRKKLNLEENLRTKCVSKARIHIER